MSGRFVVSDDYEWTIFDSLTDALAFAEGAKARGDEDVQMFEEIGWETLRPPHLRSSWKPPAVETKVAIDFERDVRGG